LIDLGLLVLKFGDEMLQKIIRVTMRCLGMVDMHASSRPGSIRIGKNTYGIKSSTISGASKASTVEIGKYCSIAPGVAILAHVEHPTYLPSTFPFRTILFKQLLESESGFNADAISRGPIVIGHDVWIGQNAIILSGITIGHGAVIGAGSVVAKDVEPYAIVAGNPARCVRHRFPAEIIEKLMAVEWWDLPDASISRLEKYFYDKDIDAFIEAVKIEKTISLINPSH
jgi:acetyltransferase-like isoleucine patch superfamily enzyme